VSSIANQRTAFVIVILLFLDRSTLLFKQKHEHVLYFFSFLNKTCVLSRGYKIHTWYRHNRNRSTESFVFWPECSDRVSANAPWAPNNDSNHQHDDTDQHKHNHTPYDWPVWRQISWLRLQNKVHVICVFRTRINSGFCQSLEIDTCIAF